MGAGKSTLGRHLSQILDYPFYDSDKVIEEKTGADIPWIFDMEGEAGFRRREHEVIEKPCSVGQVPLGGAHFRDGLYNLVFRMQRLGQRHAQRPHPLIAVHKSCRQVVRGSVLCCDHEAPRRLSTVLDCARGDVMGWLFRVTSRRPGVKKPVFFAIYELNWVFALTATVARGLNTGLQRAAR